MTDIPALVAEVEKMRALLVEARLDLEVYVDADYPENIRAQYPDMERKYQRDMDLCYRIDAALKGDEAITLDLPETPKQRASNAVDPDAFRHIAVTDISDHRRRGRSETKVWHEELHRMAEGPALYEGQQLYVLIQDHLALRAERDRLDGNRQALEAQVADLSAQLDEARAQLAREREAGEALAKEMQAIHDDCEAEYPPSHGAIKYAVRLSLAAHRAAREGGV